MEKVFVYGTLLTGLENNFYLKQSKLIGKGFSIEKYHMTARYIPFVTNDNHENSNYIYGEVWEVPDEELRKIDQLEGHPYMYERKQIDVRLDDGSVLKCWIYFYNGDVGHTEVESGNYYLWRYMNIMNRGMFSYD
jgi:gamma-glutamylcyclotransferase (GGCT)/AIG2-like uncharacterized protein YtfP